MNKVVEEKKKGVDEGYLIDVLVIDLFIMFNLSFESKEDIQASSYIEKFFASEEFLQPLNEWHEGVILYGLKKEKETGGI